MDFSVNYYNNEYNKQYLFDEEIYLKVVDSIGDYELLSLQFENSETPKFSDNARNTKIDMSHLN